MRIHSHRTFRFILTGLLATGVSMGVFRWVYASTQQALLSTTVRLICFATIAYAGYSRWMLSDILRTEQATLGHYSAELRMVGRVTASIGLSTLAKLLIEPLLVPLCLRFGGPSAITLAPLLGDLGYGPALNYGVLMMTTRRHHHAQQSTPDPASL